MTEVDNTAEGVAASTSTGGTQAEADWRTILDSVPAEELRKHTRIAGIIGSELDEKQKEATAKADRDRLRALPAEDFKREVLAAEEQAASRAPVDELMQAFQATLPDDVRTELAGKQYPNRAEYMKQAMALMNSPRSETSAADKEAAAVAQRAVERRTASAEGMRTPTIRSEGTPASLPTKAQISSLTPDQLLQMNLSDDELASVLSGK